MARPQQTPTPTCISQYSHGHCVAAILTQKQNIYVTGLGLLFILSFAQYERLVSQQTWLISGVFPISISTHNFIRKHDPLTPHNPVPKIHYMPVPAINLKIWPFLNWQRCVSHNTTRLCPVTIFRIIVGFSITYRKQLMHDKLEVNGQDHERGLEPLR